MVESNRDPAAPKPRESKIQRAATAALYALLFGLALWTVRAFLPAVVWAGVIAIALWPLLRKLETRSWLHQRPTLSATLLTLAVALFFLIPLIVVGVQAAHEAHELTHWFREAASNGLPMPDWVGHLPYGAAQVSHWWHDNLAMPLTASPAFKHVQQLQGGAVFSITREFGGRAAHAMVLFGFTLLTLFCLLRAGARLGGQLIKASRSAFGTDGAMLVTRMAASVRSTVTGLIAVGLGEGILLGLAYLIVGVPHAALLGLVTAVAAMLPFCAPLVFGAAAIWLLASGSTIGAIGLAIFGFIVVFLAEHVVRPVLIGGSARLPFLLVLFGILGGAETFGLVGLFIGPALMTILQVLWTDWVD